MGVGQVKYAAVDGVCVCPYLLLIGQRGLCRWKEPEVSGFLGVLLGKEEIQEPPASISSTRSGHGTAVGPCGMVRSSGETGNEGV